LQYRNAISRKCCALDDLWLAEEITLKHKGLSVSANLERAGAKSLKDGVVLITHGTLAHNKMEIVSSMQGLLKERGINSLALSLSLGLSNRKGMYDCAVTHTHLHTDAMDEIGLWLGWLKGKGAGPVTLVGHSRGGNQTAWFASERDDPIIRGVVLIAPAMYSQAKAAAGYIKNTKTELMPLLAKAEALVNAGKGKTVMKDVTILYCAKTSVTAEAFVSYYNDDNRKNTPTLLPRIKKPTLVIAGTEDKVVVGLPEAVKKVKSAAKLMVIEDADHFFRDLYGEDVADAIAEMSGPGG